MKDKNFQRFLQQIETAIQKRGHLESANANRLSLVPYAFALSSQAVALMSGCLVLVNLKELEKGGLLYESKFLHEVADFLCLVTQAFVELERLLKLIASDIELEADGELTAEELQSGTCIAKTARTYLEIFAKTMRQLSAAVKQRGLLEGIQEDIYTKARDQISDVRELRDSVGRLKSQAIELELNIEVLKSHFT